MRPSVIGVSTQGCTALPLSRERLWGALDVQLTAGAVWIRGSAGVGKSALVNSYLVSRERRALRLVLAPEDADPYHLIKRIATACDIEVVQTAIPDPLVVARATLQAIHERTGDDVLLVFDDHERLPAACVTQRIIAEAIGGLPAGSGLIVVSRASPPPPFSRALASGTLQLFDETTLRLDRQEVAALARHHAAVTLDDDTCDRMHALSDGWAAMVVLLAIAGIPEQDTVTHSRVDAGQVPELVFDYLAEEVLASLDETAISALETLAILPPSTPLPLSSLLENPAAEHAIRQLADRQLLVTCADDTSGAVEACGYRLHELLADVLRARIVKREGAAAIDARALVLAARLDACELCEVALQLRLEHGAPSLALTSLAELAPVALRALRWATVLEWFSKVPEELLAASAPLSLWHGVALLPINPAAARDRLEQAWSGLSSEPPFAIVCACSAIETWLFLWDDFHGMDVWIQRLERTIAASDTTLDPAFDARVCAALLNGYLMRRLIDRRRLVHLRERALELLDTTLDPAAFFQLAQAAIVTALWTQGVTDARFIAERIRQRTLASGSADDIAGVWSHAIDALLHWQAGDRRGAELAATSGLALSQTVGTDFMDVLMCYHAGIACLIDDDREAAALWSKRLSAITRPEQLMNRVCHHQLAGLVAARHDDTALARRHLEQGAECARSAGLAFSASYLQCGVAIDALERGDSAAAQRWLAPARAGADALGLTLIDFDIALCDAHSADTDDDTPRLHDALQTAWSTARRDERLVTPWWSRPTLARFTAMALDAGIEVDHVRRFIDANALQPPERWRHLQTWPWPVRVSVFGRPALRIDGDIAGGVGRRVSRPIELLHFLVACGGASPAQRLADRLWPDAQGDAVMDSLKTALARLRRLLGRSDAVVLEDGWLAVATHCCWSDVGAFERLERMTEASNEDAIDIDLKLIALYRGHLLPASDAPWLIERRQRFRRRWLRAVLRVVHTSTQAGQCASASRCLENALQLAPDEPALLALRDSRLRD